MGYIRVTGMVQQSYIRDKIDFHHIYIRFISFSHQLESRDITQSYNIATSQLHQSYSKVTAELQNCYTRVSGPIWTDLVPIRIVIFFLKIVSYGQIRAFRYKILNLKSSCTS